MDNVALAALAHANPEGPGAEAEWLGGVLARCWAAYRPGAEVRAWSVGGVQNGETLVQSRPVVREPRADFVADFLRAQAQTTLAAYASVGPSGHGSGDIQVPRLGLARFQRWVGVRAEGELSPGEDEAAALRSRLRSGLPDFLVRSLAHAGDRELSVFGFLGALHAAGDLGKPFVPAPAIRGALAALDEQLGRPARINVLVCDGRTVGVLHRGGRLLQVDAPVPTRPVRAIAGGAPRTMASVLLYDPEAGEVGSDAQRLGEGIYTLSARHPGQLETN